MTNIKKKRRKSENRRTNNTYEGLLKARNLFSRSKRIAYRNKSYAFQFLITLPSTIIDETP